MAQVNDNKGTEGWTSSSRHGSGYNRLGENDDTGDVAKEYDSKKIKERRYDHAGGYPKTSASKNDFIWRPLKNEGEIVGGIWVRADSRFRPRMLRGMTATVLESALVFENGVIRTPGQYAWWWLETRKGIG